MVSGASDTRLFRLGALGTGGHGIGQYRDCCSKSSWPPSRPDAEHGLLAVLLSSTSSSRHLHDIIWYANQHEAATRNDRQREASSFAVQLPSARAAAVHTTTFATPTSAWQLPLNIRFSTLQTDSEQFLRMAHPALLHHGTISAAVRGASWSDYCSVVVHFGRPELGPRISAIMSLLTMQNAGKVVTCGDTTERGLGHSHTYSREVHREYRYRSTSDLTGLGCGREASILAVEAPEDPPVNILLHVS